MEEFSSLWTYQENIDELKQKLFYTTLELEAVKAETGEEKKRNSETMKQMLQLLKTACQERDDAKDQLQKLLSKVMPTNDQQIFNATMTSIPNCFTGEMVRQQQHQSPLMIPAKANSSITESNSLSEAYNHSSPPVDSFFDPIRSPEFSNVNVETPYVQDYHQNGPLLNGSVNGPKVDQATLVMESMIKGKTLPEKGNLLKTVVEAGPLLQTLLLAGPLPRWRNPPPLQTFHIPSIAAAADQIAATQNQLLKPPTMMSKQSQPFAEMACGSSSQMMMAGGGNSGSVLTFGDVNFGSNYQTNMMAACSGASNFGTIGKRQRLH